MSDIIWRIRLSWRFLKHDIWSYTNEDVRGIYRWLMNIFKAVYLSIRFFLAHRIMERASALTYYTLLALVPTVALALGIGRGFGMQEMFYNLLSEAFPGQIEVINYINGFAEKYLERATSSIVIGIGIVLLLWVVYSLIGNIEDVFNGIWQVKNGRSTVRKVTDYLSIIILVPIILVISSGTQIFLQTYIMTDLYDYVLSKTLLTILRWIPYISTTLLLTFIYIVIPNCKVRFLNAFAAAVIAGAAFLLFQWLYIHGQIWVSKYNAIYGSFAALPLLLLWIQMSWIICLYGAELSYASQNIQNYNFENVEEKLSRQDRDFLLALVGGIIYNKFANEEPAPTTEEVGQALKLPARLTGSLVRQLADLDVIREGYPTDEHKPNNWIPGRETDKFSIASLTDLLASNGENLLKIDYPKFFDKEYSTFEAMRLAAYLQGQSILLRDINLDNFKPLTTSLVKEKRQRNTKSTKQ
ncbi:MAG: YihY/virulence factor BrkB family protein [Bacteroidales bacterium]|nr:YihY/virulence factor BrkB family protein [Bacteroidales bacterium]